MKQGGRLTLQAGSPVATADQVGKSAVWLCPDAHGFIETFDGSAWRTDSFLSGPTDQIGASLDISGLAANTIYRILAKYNGAGITLLPFAGINITRYDGVDVNADNLTGCPQYQGRWVGSILTDATAGQCSILTSYGQGRKYGVWNRDNQRDICMEVGEPASAYMPTNQYPAFQPFNGHAANCATIFTELPQKVEISYFQSCFLNNLSGPSGIVAAIGWNGTNKGYWNKFSTDATGGVYQSMAGMACHIEPAAIGLNVATMFIAKANNATSTVWGGSGTPVYPIELNSVMYVKYRA